MKWYPGGTPSSTKNWAILTLQIRTRNPVHGMVPRKPCPPGREGQEIAFPTWSGLYSCGPTDAWPNTPASGAATTMIRTGVDDRAGSRGRHEARGWRRKWPRGLH